MTIPASAIVSSNPGVISAGGSPLALNGVILTQNTLLPTNAVRSFSSPDAVSAFFGSASAEYSVAQTYFLGFDNSTIKPSTLYFAPYVLADRGAWLQSGSFAGYTLTQIQALTGVLTVVVDGVSFTSSTINLSAASSFSNAATLIAAGFTGTGKPTCAWNAVNSTFTLSSATTGASSTIAYATGTLSAGLKFTSATGAILSQGDTADTPDSAMNVVKAATQNWVDFMTLWEPVTADKQLFAVWANAQNQRYMYVAWDTDAQAIINGSTTCFGVVAKNLAYDGVMVVYNTKECAAFVLGSTASIDTTQTNGRITYAFKSQSGFVPTVTDEQTANNLLANGYSFYGSYATANDQFNFFYNGQISGKWKFGDSFIDQVKLNSDLQLADVNLLTNVKSVPYNQPGYALIRSAMLDPIVSALNFGSIRTGVTLSLSQKAQVNSAAGKDVASIIETQGYYLQILDPGSITRGQRGSPIINLWYTDGGSVHKISFASVAVL